MIVKDIRYIIKRIIIGVGIALILMLIKGNLMLSVNALQTISSYDMGAHTDIVTNLDRALSYYTNDTPWANQGDGYVTFTFSITKVLGNSTDPNVQPRFVTVTSGQQAFACNVGSTSIQNSTFNQSFYSATCPVYMTSSGLNSVNIGLQDNQQNGQSSYRVYFQGWLTFEQSLNNTLNNISYNNNINSQNIQGAINNSSQSIINNQNSNTQSMINYQNQNTQAIINNQNANTQAQIESQQVCTMYDSVSVVLDGKYINTNGTIVSSANFGVTDFISISPNDNITILSNMSSSSGTYGCYYDINKSLISCSNTFTFNTNIPSNASFLRMTIYKTYNKPTFKICRSGNQAIAEQNQQLQNTINDTNTDTAQDQASDFFTNFTRNNHGLSGVITAPLSMLQALTTATCNPLEFQLPFTHDTVTLPCMKAILQDKFGVFFTLWQLITTGLISYNVCLNFYSKIRDLQNPNSDRIEVLNL